MHPLIRCTDDSNPIELGKCLDEALLTKSNSYLPLFFSPHFQFASMPQQHL